MPTGKVSKRVTCVVLTTTMLAISTGCQTTTPSPAPLGRKLPPVDSVVPRKTVCRDVTVGEDIRLYAREMRDCGEENGRKLDRGRSVYQTIMRAFR